MCQYLHGSSNCGCVALCWICICIAWKLFEKTCVATCVASCLVLKQWYMSQKKKKKKKKATVICFFSNFIPIFNKSQLLLLHWLSLIYVLAAIEAALHWIYIAIVFACLLAKPQSLRHEQRDLLYFCATHKCLRC